MQKRTGPEFKLTKQQEQQIVQMYQANGSLISIARHFDVNEKTARYVLKRAGVKLRGRAGHRKLQLTAEQLHVFVQKYVDGASTEELAAEYGVSAGTVAYRLVGAGLKLRDKGFRFGADHHGWAGGRILHADSGYIVTRVYPEDPFFLMGQKKAEGSHYVLEHRLVMARHLGRPLMPDEVVHHKDGDRTNNVIGNLQLLHAYHGKGGAFHCQDCGSYNMVSDELHANR